MFRIKILEKKIMFDNLFSKIVPFMITRKNTVEPGRPQMTIWRTCISRWVPKATNTDSEYVIFIAFPLLQWFTNVPLCCVLSALPALLHIVEITSRFIQLPTGRRQSTACLLLFSQLPKCDKMYIFPLDKKTTVFWPWRFFKTVQETEAKGMSSWDTNPIFIHLLAKGVPVLLTCGKRHPITMENDVIKTATVHNKVSQLRRIFVYVLQLKFWRQDVSPPPPKYTTPLRVDAASHCRPHNWFVDSCKPRIIART
jgi:hypothetical protein